MFSLFAPGVSGLQAIMALAVSKSLTVPGPLAMKEIRSGSTGGGHTLTPEVVQAAHMVCELVATLCVLGCAVLAFRVSAGVGQPNAVLP